MTDEVLKYYCGVGSRQTPDEVMAEMRMIAAILRENGYILNSGGADGADTAFEDGAGDEKQIFLPWEGFNGRDGIVAGGKTAARKIAMRIHPYWDNLTQGGKKLHTRNACQVLGFDLKTPVDFVVCWTPDGKPSGGTRTAVIIAEEHGIPVYNLKVDKFPIDKFL
jgi:hypothetical protein